MKNRTLSSLCSVLQYFFSAMSSGIISQKTVVVMCISLVLTNLCYSKRQPPNLSDLIQKIYSHAMLMISLGNSPGWLASNCYRPSFSLAGSTISILVFITMARGKGTVGIHICCSMLSSRYYMHHL